MDDYEPVGIPGEKVRRRKPENVFNISAFDYSGAHAPSQDDGTPTPNFLGYVPRRGAIQSELWAGCIAGQKSATVAYESVLSNPASLAFTKKAERTLDRAKSAYRSTNRSVPNITCFDVPNSILDAAIDVNPVRIEPGTYFSKCSTASLDINQFSGDKTMLFGEWAAGGGRERFWERQGSAYVVFATNSEATIRT